MALTTEDLATIQNLIDTSLSTARLPQRAERPPADLVYEGNGAYYSESTKMGYAKGPSGTLIQTGLQA